MELGSTVTIKCDEGSLGLFCALLGDLGFLSLLSLLVAFPACRLPDVFSKTKHIPLSMLVCSCVWVTFIPAHISEQGKDTVPWRSLPSWHQEQTSCPASSLSVLKRTQNNKCLAGIVSSENIRNGL